MMGVVHQLMHSSIHLIPSKLILMSELIFLYNLSICWRQLLDEIMQRGIRHCIFPSLMQCSSVSH
jgi:hypothetical protein